MFMVFTVIAIVFIVLFLLFSSIRIVQQYEQGVVLRLGKYTRSLSPGVQFVIPFIDSVRRADMRIRVVEVSKQEIMTKDSVPVTLDAAVFYQVMDAQKALLDVEDFTDATATVAQTTLRKNLGAHSMQEMLAEQDQLDDELRATLDKATHPWGIKVTGVEIRSMDLPEDLKRAMAKEAEAERERKAKVIAAQGEYEAAEKLAEAADVISRNPAAMQLRTLQTMSEIAAEKTSTILFPYELSGIAPALAGISQKNQAVSV